MNENSTDGLVDYANYLSDSHTDVMEAAQRELSSPEGESLGTAAGLVSRTRQLGFIISYLEEQDRSEVEDLKRSHSKMDSDKESIVNELSELSADNEKRIVSEKLDEFEEEMEFVLRLSPIHIETDNDLSTRDTIQHLISELPSEEMTEKQKERIVELDEELLRRFKEYDISDADLEALSYDYYPPEHWWRHPSEVEKGVNRLEDRYEWYEL